MRWCQRLTRYWLPPQGLLVAILYCFVNKEVSLLICTTLSPTDFFLLITLCYSPQVQSEILKKWKRWKLGRNIEEEYRHTYSNTPNTKTGSLLNHVSRLPDIAKTSAPVCTPEERHMLVAGCCNGMVHSKEVERSVSLLHEGTISSCTLVEDLSLTDKIQCYEGQRENVESHLWEALGTRTWWRKLEGLELSSGSDTLPWVAVKSWAESSVRVVFARRSVSPGDRAALSTASERWTLGCLICCEPREWISIDVH